MDSNTHFQELIKEEIPSQSKTASLMQRMQNLVECLKDMEIDQSARLDVKEKMLQECHEIRAELDKIESACTRQCATIRQVIKNNSKSTLQLSKEVLLNLDEKQMYILALFVSMFILVGALTVLTNWGTIYPLLTPFLETISAASESVAGYLALFPSPEVLTTILENPAYQKFVQAILSQQSIDYAMVVALGNKFVFNALKTVIHVVPPVKKSAVKN